MKARLAVRPEIADARHDQGEERREEFLQVVADEEVFLPRLADHGRRVDRISSMKDGFDVKDRVVVSEGVVAVVISEGAFGPSFVWRHATATGRTTE